MELLVVMIISGIVFLLVFDGLHLLEQYQKHVSKKLTERSGLLQSHQILEASFEVTDSIRKDHDNLYLFSKGEVTKTLRMEKSFLTLHAAGRTDTLFDHLVVAYVRPDSHSVSVDSVLISVIIDKDTVVLDYGLPAYTHFYQFKTDNE
ncbi:MAG: hypothetical protein AB2L24_23765 [Mangrovibacterium sp.]